MLRNFSSQCQHQLDPLSRYTVRKYATPATKSFQATPSHAKEQPVLPRYPRRVPIPESSPEQQNESSNKKIYRSRHFNPIQDKRNKSDAGLRLLRPHTLSSRIKGLCEANKVDQAISMLKTSPRDAQNTQVWNTLILECLKAKKFSQGYKVYTDMKRRGFSPSSRTFQTLFTGLSKVVNWKTHTKQLGHAHGIYAVYLRYMDSVKKHDPTSPELSSAPLANYIKILGDNCLYQQIFDVYYALPSEGLMAPEHTVYTAIFSALALTANGQPSTISSHNAASAKLLWTQMTKASQKDPSLIVDTHVVASAIAALSQGQRVETDLAFQIIREYYGLGAPGDLPSKGHLPLSARALNVVLRLCNTSEKHTLCRHFFEEVKRRPAERDGTRVLDHWHLEEVFKARMVSPGAGHYCVETLEWMLRQEAQNGPKIRPGTVSYNLALTACRRDGDWRSAAQIFYLMTGFHPHDFIDKSASEFPKRDGKITRQSVNPTLEVLNTLVETSLASHDHANVRQCLRMIDSLKVQRLFEETSVGKGKKANIPSTLKLASAVGEAVRYITITSNQPRTAFGDIKRWRRLADVAKQLERSQELVETSNVTRRDKSPMRERLD